MSEKTYTFEYEVNDDDTGVFVRIECEVITSSKRSASSAVSKAVKAVAQGLTVAEVSEYVVAEE